MRCSVTLAGDAADEVLGEITDNAMRWSPVVNTFTNNVEVSSTLTIG